MHVLPSITKGILLLRMVFVLFLPVLVVPRNRISDDPQPMSGSFYSFIEGKR